MELSTSAQEALKKELHKKIGIYLYGDELKKLLEIVNKYVPIKAFSKDLQNEEEAQIDHPRFHGKAYDEKLDQKPFKKSALLVFHYLASHPDEWFTPWEISDRTNVNEVTVTNRIRDFRTKRWGDHATPKSRRMLMTGRKIWAYMLIPNKNSLTWKEYLKNRASLPEFP